jgi:Mg2+/citrate symporter
MAQEENSEKEFAFGKENYIITIVGLVFIIAGFTLMAGGGSEDPTVFSEEIFSTRRITVAPLVVLLGFAIQIFGIMYRSKS